MGLLAGDEWYYWDCLVAEYSEKGHPPGWMDGVPPVSHAILCLQLFSTYQGKGLYPDLSTGDEAKPHSVLLHPSLSLRSGMAAPFRQGEWAARKKANYGIRVRPEWLVKVHFRGFLHPKGISAMIPSASLREVVCPEDGASPHVFPLNFEKCVTCVTRLRCSCPGFTPFSQPEWRSHPATKHWEKCVMASSNYVVFVSITNTLSIVSAQVRRAQ